MISIFIEGKIYSSKNSRRILVNRRTGKPFVAKSQKSKSDEESFATQFSNNRETWEKMIAGVEYPLEVVFEFRRATKAVFDYVNIAQGLLDAMVKAGYVPDDDANHILPVFVPYSVSKTHPGCVITVRRE